MKGDVSIGIIVTMIIVAVSAALISGAGSQTVSGADNSLNNTSSQNQPKVGNVSCKRSCIESHPSKGPQYYTCVNGC